MQKVVIVGGLILLTILLIFVGIYSYRGNELTFIKMNLETSSSLDLDETIICEGYHQEKITTYEEFVTFENDCGVVDDTITEAYFLDSVLVIYLSLEPERLPTAFFDHPFSTNGIEVINYRREKEVSDTPMLYIIYASKDDIISEDVIFDVIQ